MSAKALVCKRGHDTSFPEARYTNDLCKKCSPIIRTRKPETQLAYELSYARQKSRYSQYKKTLTKRIAYKKQEIERYEKEI